MRILAIPSWKRAIEALLSFSLIVKYNKIIVGCYELQPKYRKVLLKFSSESLTGGKEHGTDFSTVLEIYAPIEACVDPDVQANIVAGGGNFWRGRSSGEMGRTRADHIGILATVINAFDVVNVLEQLGVPIRAQTAATAQ